MAVVRLHVKLTHVKIIRRSLCKICRMWKWMRCEYTRIRTTTFESILSHSNSRQAIRTHASARQVPPVSRNKESRVIARPLMWKLKQFSSSKL
jgi:hypothetical protein